MAKASCVGAEVEIESRDEAGAAFEVTRERLLFLQLATAMKLGPRG